jgi:NAD(P)-dependent dehydrogenase (short-subunit alcohol dehydrogenase family)
MNLTGKVALVTGAGNLRGIGRGIAVRLAEEGADLAISYLDRVAEAYEVRREIHAIGRRALLVQADISDASQIKKMFDVVVSEFGRLDILINNAGVCEWQEILDITVDSYHRIVDVNVFGTIECSRHAVEIMSKTETKGRIVNISSIQAKRPTVSLAIYSATKAAIDHFSQSLAMQVAHKGITVNQVWPGFVDTDINNAKPELKTEQGRRQILGHIPIGKFVTPNDIGASVAYFCRDSSQTVTGSALKVDGGSLLRCLL